MAFILYSLVSSTSTNFIVVLHSPLLHGGYLNDDLRLELSKVGLDFIVSGQGRNLFYLDNLTSEYTGNKIKFNGSFKKDRSFTTHRCKFHWWSIGRIGARVLVGRKLVRWKEMSVYLNYFIWTVLAGM